MSNPFRKFFKPKLKLVRGTRFVSFLFIASSVIIAAGILWAANIYYNIDTGQLVTEEIQNITKDLIISGANQALKFTGGTNNYYVGFKAPTGITTTTTYTWPATYPTASGHVLQSTQTGALTWLDLGTAGLGTITAVGNVTSGAAFTETGDKGTSLWFYDASGRGQLTIANLTATTTYILPNLSGTVALQSTTTLTAGGVLFANVDGLITQDDYFTYSGNTLQVGSGGIKLLGASSGYIGLKAAAASDSTNYTWPGTVSGGKVLSTDASGNLSWETVAGVGGVTGTGVANYLAKWTGTSTIATSSIVDNYTGGTALTIAVTTGDITVANNLTVSGTGGVTASLFTGPSNTTTTIASANSNNIYLDPDGSGKIIIASGDYIKTASGYEIGKANTEILREMIPILGFDLPVRCGTACETATTVSRTIEDYAFSSAAAGTNRIHKFVIRYADSTTTASSTWTVWNETGATTTATFQVPASASTDLAKGEAYITPAVTIPINADDWNLRVQVSSGVTIQIYEIFLAAYDQIQ